MCEAERMASPRSGSLVSADVRRHNLALIAGALARLGPLSRSQLADATGLTRGAVTALVAALTESGLVREAEEAGRAGARGRPSTLLRLTADDSALLTLQLDADHAVAALTALDGTELVRIAERHGRPMGDPEPILDILGRVLARALDAAAARGRGIAACTVVAFAPVGGLPPVVVADTDLGWGTVDVLAALRRRVPGMPEATLVADSATAAIAELHELDGVRDMLYVKSNSGIGGAIVSGGELLLGAHGFAGAVGHLPIVPGGAACACGQHGCLVTVAGPDVVLAEAGLGGLLARDGLTEALHELVRRIGDGEPRALAAWKAALPWIARTLRVLCGSVDPRVIVVGGYWAELADSLAEAFAALAPTITATTGDIAVRPGRLGADAALLGAARAARDDVLADPHFIQRLN